jgi:glutamyl-Q tRNA(Asp) synthetase
LHLGSLLAAVGSYLSARSASGRWLLRIEDLDRNRAIPGIADQMLRVLESFGFQWDGKVEFQNNRISFYEEALARLREAGLCYACRCSRSQLAAQALEPGQEPVYPGSCRNAPAAS